MKCWMWPVSEGWRGGMGPAEGLKSALGTPPPVVNEEEEEEEAARDLQTTNPNMRKDERVVP